MSKILKVGSFEMPVLAALNITQRFEFIGGDSILRMISGRGVHQSTWKKYRIVTSGSGWFPAGLEEVDTESPQYLACIKFQTVTAPAASRQAVLPVARRSDAGHVPFALAVLANNRMVGTSLSIAGNLATCSTVAGAVCYKVAYYPLILCHIGRPSSVGPDSSWEFTAEEI